MKKNNRQSLVKRLKDETLNLLQGIKMLPLEKNETKQYQPSQAPSGIQESFL